MRLFQEATDKDMKHDMSYQQIRNNSDIQLFKNHKLKAISNSNSINSQPTNLLQSGARTTKQFQSFKMHSQNFNIKKKMISVTNKLSNNKSIVNSHSFSKDKGKESIKIKCKTQSSNQIQCKFYTKNQNEQQNLRNSFLKVLQEDNIIRKDPQRVSRYHKSWHYSNAQQKWDQNVKVYMEARQKMSNFFNKTKRNSGNFDEIELDRKNLMYQNRKLLQLKSKSPKKKQEKHHSKSTGFVSHLVKKNPPYFIKKGQHFSKTEQQTFKRCDALLVNFVSTYFRRKFFKRNRRSLVINKINTNLLTSTQMVDLQGNIIQDEIIKNQMLSADVDQTENIQVLNN